MRRAPLLVLILLAAAAVWFMATRFPGLAGEAVEDALPPMLAGGPATEADAVRPVIVEGRILRIDTAMGGAIRLALRDTTDSAVTVTALIDTASAVGRSPLPPVGTRVRLAGVRPVRSLEIRP